MMMVLEQNSGEATSVRDSSSKLLHTQHSATERDQYNSVLHEPKTAGKIHSHAGKSFSLINLKCNSVFEANNLSRV